MLPTPCDLALTDRQRMDVELAHGGAISKAWEERAAWTAVPLNPGDVLCFGSHLAHRSGPNQTTTRRAMIYATYHGRSDGLDLRQKYYSHRRENFPPENGKHGSHLRLAHLTSPQSALLVRITAKVTRHTRSPRPSCQRQQSSRKLQRFNLYIEEVNEQSGWSRRSYKPSGQFDKRIRSQLRRAQNIRSASPKHYRNTTTGLRLRAYLSTSREISRQGR
jgi:hypothetical protein